VRRLILAALLAAATELSGLALVTTAAWLIARASQQPPIVALTVAIVAVRAFAISKGTLRYVERLAGHDAALGILARLRTRVFAALVDSAPAPVAGQAQGDLLTRLVSDVDGVQDALLRCAIPAAVSAMVCVVTVGFTAFFSLPAALLLLTGQLLAGLALPALAYVSARDAAGRLAAARAGYVTTAIDVLDGAADLAAFGAAPAAADRADRAASELASLERRSGRASVAVAAAGALLPGATALASCDLTLHSGLSVIVAVLALLALTSVEAMLPLTTAAVRLADLRGALSRVRALLDTPPGAASGRRRPPVPDVALDLSAGRRIAVIGPSGAGKSTLLGAIADWPRAGGLLADAYVFHASVRENVTLGRDGLADDQVGAALELAGIPDFRDQLDRTVGEDGGTLSGGQRQRLLLARALVAPSPVLLLDEPTEGLDPVAADAVQADVVRATAGHTVVLVTHRLVGLDGFDEIVVLDKGRAVQRGRPADLLHAPGWYAAWAGELAVATWEAAT
jgi:ATP-binding cassette subfamily C protein CydC